MHVQLFRILLFLSFAFSAEAQVYKCNAADGSVAYQQIPCPEEHSQSVPKIQKEPTLTGEEKFNAEAYAAGMTPEQARQLLSGQTPPTTPQAAPAPYIDQYAQQQDLRRAADCNNRYDELARQAKETFRSAKAQGNLSRHLERIENERSNCLYGSGVSGQPQNPLLPSRNIGQCQGHCSSEQGICIASCNGNGSCIGNCSASHGRCVAACSY